MTQRILQYIKATPNQSVFYLRISSIQLKAFEDSNWATCPDTKRSITGLCVFLGDSLVSWKSKKQSTISSSSTNAEYGVMTKVTSKIIRLLPLIKDLHILHQTLALLFYDNHVAFHIATNTVFHDKTKHIKIDCHVIREKIQNDSLKTLHISSQHQLVDILIKSLHPTQFMFIGGKVGLQNVYSLSLRGLIRNWNFQHEFVIFSSFYSFFFLYQPCYFVLAKESWNSLLIVFCSQPPIYSVLKPHFQNK